MKILNLTETPLAYSNRLNNSPSYPAFCANGQPLKLKYIIENRSYVLPERVLNEAKRLLAHNRNKVPSLLEIHKKIYKPLLKCKTLEEAKTLFPEFENVKNEINFVKNNHYKKIFEERFTQKDFALKMLQEYWGNLCSIKEICEASGLKNRASLEWPLEEINFPKFHNQYKNILLASDKNGTRILAKRVQDFDNINTSRKEKISQTLYARWLGTPEIRQAMSEFATNEGNGYRKMLDKINAGKELSEVEKRMNKGFFKRFWAKYSELKKHKSDLSKK